MDRLFGYESKVTTRLIHYLIASLLCFCILNYIGTVIARTTVKHVTQDKNLNTEIMNIIRDYHKVFEKVIDNDQYVSTESEFERFVVEDVPDTREESY